MYIQNSKKLRSRKKRRNLTKSPFFLVFVPASKSSTHVGWGSRIRTYECQSQSLVPYRLAIPQRMILAYYITKKQSCQDSFSIFFKFRKVFSNLKFKFEVNVTFIWVGQQNSKRNPASGSEIVSLKITRRDVIGSGVHEAGGHKALPYKFERIFIK